VAGLVPADPQPYRPNDRTMLGDRELMGLEPERVRHEGVSVRVGVGPWDVGHPSLNLGVLARRMDRLRIVLSPRSHHDRVVVKLHPSTLSADASR